MKKTMNNSLKCATFFATLVSISSQAEMLPRNTLLDKMMYTISPTATTTGPVYRDQNSQEDKNAYGNEMFKLMIKKAHEKAKRFLEVGDTQAYYAFLTLGLTVPLQEGLYIQYRGVTAPVCNQVANSGELIKKLGSTTHEYFLKYLSGGENPFLANCETVDQTKEIKQIIRGYDGSDLSVMQVSVRWHADDFLANRKFESTEKTLDYGYSHLMSGFEPVYRNIEEYKCLIETKKLKKKKEVSYINLIRGVWAGKYNSGSISKTCRFADSSSPYKHHDKGFETNLNKVLNFEGKIGGGGALDFQLNNEITLAVKEIVTNLKEKSNKRENLDKILSL